MDAAERLDRLDDLGRQVRDHVAAIFDARPVAGPVSVNLHPRDLEDEHLYRPEAALSRLASSVILELTERAPLRDVSRAREQVQRLKQLGFRIAVDDLGAGYAGLGCFIALEPDLVKLDLSLVRDIDRDGLKQRLVRSTVQPCHESGMLVVAEGVETEDERRALVDLGCDLLQGYLLGRPQQPGAA